MADRRVVYRVLSEYEGRSSVQFVTMKGVGKEWPVEKSLRTTRPLRGDLYEVLGCCWENITPEGRCRLVLW